MPAIRCDRHCGSQGLKLGQSKGGVRQSEAIWTTFQGQSYHQIAVTVGPCT
jgi:hypothetical protein